MLPQTLFPSGTTKTAIATIAQQAVNEAIENGNPIAAAEIVAALEGFTKAVKEIPAFKDAILSELALNSGKISTPSGAKIEEMEGGVSYNYSANPAWVELDQTIATLDTKKKALEARLRAIPAGKMLVDDDSGETLIGPSKSSKTTYKITLAK